MRKSLGVVCLLGALALAGVAVEMWDQEGESVAHEPLISLHGFQALGREGPVDRPISLQGIRVAHGPWISPGGLSAVSV